MLAMIDSFPFELDKKAFDTLDETIDFDWASSTRIGTGKKHQAVGSYDESFSIKGTLLLKSINAFEDLKDIGKEKKPVSLSFSSGKSILVIIKSIKVQKDLFIKSGEFLRQGFTIELKRWYL